MSLRLGLTTAAAFLLGGAALLVVNYLLVRRRLPGAEMVVIPFDGQPPRDCPGPGCQDVSLEVTRAVGDAARTLRQQTLDELVVQSLWTLAVASVLAAVAGWAIARRAVRPVHAITAAARSISEHDLDQRLEATGPQDELKELADTFDGMLARLDVAFAAQRRFAAAASHELRTPLAVQRTMIDVALADPASDRESLLHTVERLRTLGTRQERLIDGLLQLATAQARIDLDETVDLGSAVRDAVDALGGERQDLRVTTSLAPSNARGDAALLGRAVANLVENAVRHNRHGGAVEVRTFVRDGRAVLLVSNDGPDLTGHDLGALQEPFRRGTPSRTGSHRGSGLGLAVVTAVAAAHGGQLELRARPGGGLRAELRLPVDRGEDQAAGTRGTADAEPVGARDAAVRRHGPRVVG